MDKTAEVLTTDTNAIWVLEFRIMCLCMFMFSNSDIIQMNLLLFTQTKSIVLNMKYLEEVRMCPHFCKFVCFTAITVNKMMKMQGPPNHQFKISGRSWVDGIFS